MGANFREIARTVLPAGIIDAIRARRKPASMPASESRFVWEGIFEKYCDVPASGTGHDNPQWLGRYVSDVNDLRAAYAANGATAPSSYGEHHLLCILAALIGRGRRNIRVLDFGGGIGPGFVHLSQCLKNCSEMTYTIVDTPAMCGKGREMFHDDLRVQFVTEIPDKPSQVDIVYINSVLQYIEDYESVLNHLCSCGPEYVLLTRLNAGNNPRFATAQRNLPGSVVPYWFHNASEISGIIAVKGFAQLYQSITKWGHDLSNFPLEYRIPGTMNLLFGRLGGESKVNAGLGGSGE